MEILKAVIFGFVQGVTEWIPVSGTGHMILLNEFLPLYQSGEFLELFFVVIQFGSILAVLFLFWKRMVSCAVRRRLPVEAGYPSPVGKDSRGLYSGWRGRVYLEGRVVDWLVI